MVSFSGVKIDFRQLFFPSMIFYSLCYFEKKINFLFSNKACWVNLSCLKYQVVSSLLFHILPPVSEESVYRAITVKAPQIYVFQSPPTQPNPSLPISNSHLIKRTPFLPFYFLSHQLVT